MAETPYLLRHALDTMIGARRAGLRAMFGVGYTWAHHDDPARNFPRFVSKEGELAETMICPLSPHPWRDNLVRPTLDALTEADKLGVPNLFFGVWFDMEPQASMGSTVGDTQGYCYCDHCWRTFAESDGTAKPDLSPENRHKWLLLKGKLEAYHDWQEKAVTKMILDAIEPVRARAPAILMDDETYWGGYTEKPNHAEGTRKAIIEMLGHGPLDTPSIAYCSPERNADGSPRYPTYTPERAGREAYLLSRAAIGFLPWGGTRDTTKSLLQDQRIF
jgi:hypothetical protein